MAEDLGEIRRLEQLTELMAGAGATRLFFKRLSPNDNSKNQIYLGGGYGVLSLLPFGDVTTDKSRKDSKRDRFKANLNLYWLSPNGYTHGAPQAQLILYPKYPEVRMSGVLAKAKFAPSRYINSRDEGRVLFLGTTPDGRIIAHVVGRQNPLVDELAQCQILQTEGVLEELPLNASLLDARDILLGRLKEIYELGWIDSVKLDAAGTAHPYKANNGGGYTLEAMLGVIPNGLNEPDFLGWEVKQHKSSVLHNPIRSGVVTLMTPEPTGGYYKLYGVESFIRKFGYPDKNGVEDRLNFGGIHRFNQRHDTTNLIMSLEGFNEVEGKIENIDGGIQLTTTDSVVAAEWSFSSLLEKWNRKHEKTAIVPSQTRKSEINQYRYGHVIGLGRDSRIDDFLKAIAANAIYYDPGIKLTNASSDRPKTKQRSQFRIKAKDIPMVYRQFELVDLLEMNG